jgi:phage portal protein BeeE
LSAIAALPSDGGLDWKALSLSPKDMDFAESKAGAAREIALAFGAPPLLLGLPGDNPRLPSRAWTLSK